MNEFNSLLYTLERLLAPDGCPWDREQTMQSMRPSLVEETFEVIEAIDLNDNRQMEEELGDLLFNVIFLCMLAEKEKRFNLQDVLRHIVAKLIRRHPHIFGEGQLKTSEEVLKQWEKIKHLEKEGQSHSALDGIPTGLPALARAQKVAKRLASKHFAPKKTTNSASPEEQAGELLWEVIQPFVQQGIYPEHALRKRLLHIESEFRQWEQQQETLHSVTEDQS